MSWECRKNALFCGERHRNSHRISDITIIGVDSYAEEGVIDIRQEPSREKMVTGMPAEGQDWALNISQGEMQRLQERDTMLQT